MEEDFVVVVVVDSVLEDHSCCLEIPECLSFLVDDEF